MPSKLWTQQISTMRNSKSKSPESPEGSKAHNLMISAGGAGKPDTGRTDVRNTAGKNIEEGENTPDRIRAHLPRNREIAADAKTRSKNQLIG